ncbi:hypothetical protein QR680_019315 [Steinernema hermaphroditum]|uniref:F-box domain-containing protein n=1 Tax=Steinernema hermaphroditum TaxID=289476 RepID=A0AA39GN04_9BILA|nr:hypothetical protein QR680_019315 [Steinernema hermaphroditum]
MVALLNIPLPYTIVEDVLSYISATELLLCRLVCRQWKDYFDLARPMVNVKDVKITQDCVDELTLWTWNNGGLPRPKWLQCFRSQATEPGMPIYKGHKNPVLLDLKSLEDASDMISLNRFHFKGVKFTSESIKKISQCTRKLSLEEVIFSNCHFDEVTSTDAEQLLSSFGTCLKSFDIRFGRGLENIKEIIEVVPNYYPNLNFMAMKPAIQLDEHHLVTYFYTDVTPFLSLSTRLQRLQLSGLSVAFSDVVNMCENWRTSLSPSVISMSPYLLNTSSLNDSHIVLSSNFTIRTRTADSLVFEIAHGTRDAVFLRGKVEIFADPTTPKYKCALNTQVKLRNIKPHPLEVRYTLNGRSVDTSLYYSYKENGRIHKCTNELSVKVPEKFWVTVCPSKETVFAVVCSSLYTESVCEEPEFVLQAGKAKSLKFDLSKSPSKRVCLYGWVLTDDIREISPNVLMRSCPEFIQLCSTYLRFSPQ